MVVGAAVVVLNNNIIVGFDAVVGDILRELGSHILRNTPEP